MNGTWLGGSSPADGTMTASGATVVFTYDMDMVDIEIYVRDKNGDPLAGVKYENESANLHSTTEAQKGTDVTIYAPIIEDWVAIETVSYTYTNIKESQNPTFIYITVEEAADKTYVKVTIKGTDKVSSSELYSNAMQIEKDDLPYTLIDGVDILAVPHYTLDAGQNHKVPGVGIYSFNYTPADAVVTPPPGGDNKPAPIPKPPTQISYKASSKTGDDFPVVVWLTLAVVTLLGLLFGIALLRWKKRIRD
jgi:hypothetical protein